MGMAKRMLEEHEDLLAEIARVAVEQKAVSVDEETDEVSSNLDEQADKDTFAAIFKAWAEGRINGSADEIFEAVKEVLS